MAQTPLQTSIAELRAKPRLKSLIAATIVYNNGQCTLDCVIRNISETGAKLSVPASVALPDRFDLTVPQRSATYRAQYARRGEIGVLFDGVSAVSDAGRQTEAATKQRIRELEAEVTRLKSRIAQLTEG